MAVCAHCGQDNPDGFRFCGSCGAAMAEAPRSEERKVVTVLFADLVGFTGRSERMDVEDVRGTLAPYHALLREHLEHYGGTVEKFIGDAVMALFGAPVTHEDDPERAVRAALSIRAAIDRLNEREPGLDLHVRVGVNTGEALVVLGADAGRGEGMASGDVVNTAARLQAAAPVDGILVGETTYRATDRAITYRPADPVVAKGKAQPLPAWEAVEARARLGVDVVQRPDHAARGPRRRDRPAARCPAPQPRRARRPARHARWRTGDRQEPPRLGAASRPWSAIRTSSPGARAVRSPTARESPTGRSARWSRPRPGILDSDSGRGGRREAHGDRRRSDRATRRRRPGSRSTSGRSPASRPGRRAATTGTARPTRRGAASSRPSPTVIRSSWSSRTCTGPTTRCSTSSTTWLDWASGVPMLVVCTARPELLDRRRGWGGGKRNALTDRPLSAPRLRHRAADRHPAGAGGAPGRDPGHAARHGRGQPALRRGVRADADRPRPPRHDDSGRWRLPQTAALPVPESVHGLIAARLDDLPPDQKSLLQDAAVIGKVVWLGALAAMSGREPFRGGAAPARARAARDAASRATVVGRRRDRVRVSPRAVRDVAYGQIPRAQRAEKHRRAAEWIESLSADRENAPDMLAHHYAQALEYARDAGQPTEELERRTRLALRDAAERATALNSFALGQQSLLRGARAVAGGRSRLAAAGRRWPRTSAV